MATAYPNHTDMSPEGELEPDVDDFVEEGLSSDDEEKATIERRQKIGAMRSAAACQLCRSQKMKCEGPDHAPCWRCRKAQVPCVFGESQGKARQILWTRTVQDFENRVRDLEQKVFNNDARIDQVEKNIRDEHERARDNQWGSITWPKKREEYTRALQACQPGYNRSDLVDRGIISEAKAKELVGQYFVIVAPMFPWLPITTPFDKLRMVSPLLLACCVAAAARAIGDDECYGFAHVNATSLIPDILGCETFAASRSQRQSYHDILGLMLYTLYSGFALDPALCVKHAEQLRLRDSLRLLADKSWQDDDDQQDLLGAARTYMALWFFSTLQGSLTAGASSIDLTSKRDTLFFWLKGFRESREATTDWDRWLPRIVDHCLIMEEAVVELSASLRLGILHPDHRVNYVISAIQRLHEWHGQINPAGEGPCPFAQETDVMYHRAVIFLANYCILPAGPPWSENRLRVIRDGVDHGLALLKHFLSKPAAMTDTAHIEFNRLTVGLTSALLVSALIWIPHEINSDHVRHELGCLSAALAAAEISSGTRVITKWSKALRENLELAESSRLSRSVSPSNTDGSSEPATPFDQSCAPGSVINQIVPPSTKGQDHPNVISNYSSALISALVLDSTPSYCY